MLYFGPACARESHCYLRVKVATRRRRSNTTCLLVACINACFSSVLYLVRLGRRNELEASCFLCRAHPRLTFPLTFSRPARCSIVPHPLYLPELLVLAWGVFFITKSRDTEPTLKARNFAKVLQRGGSKKRKRRKLDSAAAAEASGHDGPRPQDWDSASDDDRNDSSASDSGAIEKVRRETNVVAQFEFAKFEFAKSGQQEAQATELSPQVGTARSDIYCLQYFTPTPCSFFASSCGLAYIPRPAGREVRPTSHAPLGPTKASGRPPPT